MSDTYPWCPRCEEAPFGVPREVTSETVMKKMCCGKQITKGDWDSLKARLRAEAGL